MGVMDLSAVFPFSTGGIAIIVIRTLVIYFGLLIGIMVSGKRELGQRRLLT